MDYIPTPSNVMFALGILGIIFSVYNYFKNPQIALDKKQSLDREEVEGKASLLAQQVQWEKESTAMRFKEMQDNLLEANKIANNHIHTVDTKVDALSSIVTQMGKDIVRLTTIIEERIPKK